MKAVLLAGISFCTGGCLVVPMVPHYRDGLTSRENMDAPLQEKFPPPGTARETVLLRLGAPDEAWGETRLLYRWRKIVGEVGVIVGPTVALNTTYTLEIEFDDRGEVTVTRQTPIPSKPSSTIDER